MGTKGSLADVSVIGAGVSGLSTGIRLLEAGYKVKIFSQYSSPNTVSDTAAAWWYPFLVAVSYTHLTLPTSDLV